MSKKTFSVNNTLYSTDDIQGAIEAFEGYNIIYSDSTMTIDDEDPQLVFDELMNYTISLSLEHIPGA